MAVDLDRCTGCGACVTACHAENNIPTVGPEQAARGRAMHWIRVERYWEGDFPDVRLKFRPVMCQQCDAAPCEPVCPTYASHHTEEGLNAQVYNRCIGTRYCANACPYNVRVLRLLQPAVAQAAAPAAESRRVGPRSRRDGEVHVLRAADQRGADRRQGRTSGRSKDGEVKPACVQACSAKALVFGDLNDPESEVARLARSPRGASCSRISARCPTSPISQRQSRGYERSLRPAN